MIISQNFCLAFIDELENNYLLKKLLKWANKNVRMLIRKIEYFQKKIKKSTTVSQKSWWYDLQFLWYRVWQTEIGNYLSFLPFYLPPHLKTQKITILKKQKKLLEISSFSHLYQKPQSYEVWFLRRRVRQTKSFVILGHFLPFYPPNNPQNQNFEKMKKSTSGYHYFTQVYQK